jgi:hypothetical protein
MSQATIAATLDALRRGRARPAGSLGTPIAELRKVFTSLFDPYRPELHYMRGPGPKWHQKHEKSGSTD